MPLTVELVGSVGTGPFVRFPEQVAKAWSRHLSPNRQFMITINLTDNKTMRRLNRRFRGKDKPTNVLSFPVHRFRRGRPPATLPPGPILLGEVIINIDQVNEEAAESGQKPHHYAQFLVEHGIRHLLGFHHK